MPGQSALQKRTPGYRPDDSRYAAQPTTLAISAAAAKAERDVLTGIVPPRMTTTPTTILTKASGITGTPTVAAGGTGYVVGDQITLTGGTTLTAAILQVASVTSGAVTAVTVIRNGVYTANPANPVAQGTTTGTGTGATFTVAWSANGASTSISRQQVGATDARIRYTGTSLTNLSASTYYGSGTANGHHTSFEWATNAQHVDILLGGLNVNGILYVNGQQVSATPVLTDASGNRWLYALDLGSAAWRNFRFLAYNQAFNGLYLDGVASIALPVAPKPLAWSLGDSYTGGTGAENAGSNHVTVMGDLLGVDVLPNGIGGAGWNSTSTTAPAARVAAELAGLSRVPDYVFLDLGYNDAGGDMAALATSFEATYAAIRSAAPAARILCFGPATPVGATTNLDLVRAALQARCAAHGIPYIDVRNWVNTTNSGPYGNGDNVHPNAIGHKYLGARRAVNVAPLL